MSRRHAEHEEHENHERWLVTYADMVTLLMVLFIVMFAMSTVDQKKFNALKSGLAAGFGQSTSVLDGSSSILEEPGTSVAAPIAPNQAVQDLPPGDQKIVQDTVAKTQQLAAQRNQATADAEKANLDATWAKVAAALKAHNLQDDVQATVGPRGLTISLVSRHIVFENDVATLTPRGMEVLDTLAPVLSSLPNSLAVEGHTNQVAVAPRYFPTDWELSAARAVYVLRVLNERFGIPNERMTASAFGHTRPLEPPSQAGSQDVNKRVDIVVETTLPQESASLIGAASLGTAGNPTPATRTTTTHTTAGGSAG
ncbi:OmpA/MotB family protein [Lapillicoccus jejuensis]|uniref:Chemotaxis protein MotB n=1 Tax=Lapillicoccus jejuensis TaxID=402171 RepID=A0A542E4B6_9MICO|nr:flagellar motor protein MotB [Lapillicoccus jejuensis]TQJ10155.1 chemotaxis protein MotB [Lapillicoccus jejuensis]